MAANETERKSVKNNLLQGGENKTEAIAGDPDVTCGFWIFRGDFLQRYATETVYAVIYGLLGCLLAMTLAYFNGTITTLEKRFKIPSKVTGVIAVGNDISQMLASVFVGYYAGRGNRPRWMGFGLLFVVAFCGLTALPHFLYGPGDDALKLTKEFGSFNGTRGHWQAKRTLCSLESEVCVQEELDNWLPKVLLFVAQFVSGIGSAIFYTLGLAYMDDNLKRSKTPVMLSGSSFLRMLGPAIGYTLSSFCLRLYISPSLTPLIGSSDTRWLGAWWLGWIVLAVVTLLCSFLIFMFPKELPSTRARRLKSPAEFEDHLDHKDPSLKDMLQTIKRLARNKVYVYNNLSTTLFLFGYTAYWMYTPKYIEVQYRQSASTSNMVTGTVALGFSAAGILISGWVVSKYKPSARAIAAWNGFVDIATVIGCLSYMLIGCSGSDNIASLSPTGLACSGGCHCDYVQYSPVCGADSVTYISPCHAGCGSMRRDPNGLKLYENCTCVGNLNQSTALLNLNSFEQVAKDGACPVDCFPQFVIFLSVMCVLKFLGATARSTNILIALRCVATRDKTFAMGLGMMQISLLTFIPSPIFFGWLLDSVCLIFGKNCSQKGNCWLYDTKALRYKLNIVAAVFILLGSFFNLGVWVHVKNVKIFDEKKPANESKELQPLAKIEKEPKSTDNHQ